MKKILTVGKSTLSKNLKPICNDYEYIEVGRPEYDLSQRDHCDALVEKYDPDILLLTQGIFEGDVWDQLVVNSASMVYLATQFYNKMHKGQIICVSSASAIWPSWPNVAIERLVYGLSKQTVSHFCEHMQRRNYTVGKPVAVQCYEPCRFESKINNFKQGISISEIIKDVRYLIDNPTVAHIRKIDV